MKEFQSAGENDFVIKRIKGDKVIWTIFFFLAMASIALVYSASGSLAFKANTTNFPFLLKQLRYLGIGFLALYICYKIPVGWYRLLAKPALWGSVGLSCLMLAMGGSINGASRWMSIGSTSFQPTEFVKIGVILYLARVLELNSSFSTFKQYFTKIVIPLGIVCVVMLASSASTAIFLALISFIILVVAGIKRDYIMKTIGMGAGIVAFILVVHFTTGAFERLDTVSSRLSRFFQSEEQQKEMTEEERRAADDKTYQEDMAKIAVSSVGILGKGPGKSTQRYVLPHAYSDYIYAIIIEEYGLIGGIGVLMLYIWLLYRCVLLMRECTKIFAALVVFGYGLLITAQATLHILVNVGIFPVTGHTLPMVSSGGTSIMVVCAMLGIILSVSRTIDISERKKAENIATTD